MMEHTDEEIDTCVKLKKNSWHRKLHDKVYGKHKLQYYERKLKLDKENNSYYEFIWKDRKINLCPYMRKVVWACVLFPFLLIWRRLPQSWQYHEELAKAISIYVVLCSIAHILINLEWDVWYAGLLGFFGGLGIASGCWGLALLLDRLKEKMYYRGSKTFPSGSLFKAYFRSKHEKICPCIEFVEDKKNDSQN